MHNLVGVAVVNAGKHLFHQHGSILVKESDFRTVTGNSDLKNLAIWLEKDAEPQQVVLDIKNLGEMMKEMKEECCILILIK